MGTDIGAPLTHLFEGRWLQFETGRAMNHVMGIDRQHRRHVVFIGVAKDQVVSHGESSSGMVVRLFVDGRERSESWQRLDK
ncbi:hypothetical protein D3C80_1895280 [compost metagenome]